MSCLKCEKPTTNPKFCSKKCANSYNNKLRTHSDKTKKKISNGVKNSDYLKEYRKNKIEKSCGYCNNKFETKNYEQKYCSIVCSNKGRSIKNGKYEKYRLKCQFNFNIYDFPNQFNLSLIKKFGWYKAKNKGNNLNGISRDHMLSIYDGFKNDVLSEIISHPANCKLMPHQENNSKNTTSSISLSELKQRIKNW